MGVKTRYQIVERTFIYHFETLVPIKGTTYTSRVEPPISCDHEHRKTFSNMIGFFNICHLIVPRLSSWTLLLLPLLSSRTTTLGQTFSQEFRFNLCRLCFLETRTWPAVVAGAIICARCTAPLNEERKRFTQESLFYRKNIQHGKGPTCSYTAKHVGLNGR